MSGVAISCQVKAGGDSVKIALSTTSAQTAALTSTSYLVTPDTTCFVRAGANPTALSNGTDQILIANNSYRIVPINPGDKMAFILASGTGNVYLTPDA